MQPGTGMKLRVVLLAGLPSSGKTELALKLRLFGWDHIQCHAESTVPSLQSALKSSLQAGRDVVVDSKNLTKAERHQWLSVASETVPKAADGSGGVSQFVVISAMTPTGQDALLLDPAHLQYRQNYLSAHYTANLSAEKAVEYIHSVIAVLDPSFEVPYTTEGIESLAHVRSQSEQDQVLGWLSQANQFAMSRKPGWSTPVASTSAAAAAQWCQAHGIGQPAAGRAVQSSALLPPAPAALGGPPAMGASNGMAQQPGAYDDQMQSYGNQQETPGLGMGSVAPYAENGQRGMAGMQHAGVQGGGGYSYAGMQGSNAVAYGAEYANASQPAVNSYGALSAAQPAGNPYGAPSVAQQSYTPAMAMGQSASYNVNGINTFTSLPQASPSAFAGGHGYAMQQTSNASPWGVLGETPIIKQEYNDAMSGKRPYEHGPGANDAWGSPDVKRQASGFLANQIMPAGRQGMQQQQPQQMLQQRMGLNRREPNPDNPPRTGPPQPLDIDMTDPRPIILFELSGVLCNSTKDRMTTRTRNHMPRPGIGHLARLMPHFRIGIYSTAIRKTVLAALAVVSSAIRGELASAPDGWKMLQGGTPPLGGEGAADDGSDPHSIPPLQVPPAHQGLPRSALTPDDIQGSLAWGLVFEEALILHREHTDVKIQELREVTVKVVNTLFPDPDTQRKVLVVDEAHFNQRDDNFVAVRKWDQDNRGDDQIQALVASLLQHLPECDGDVRTITGKINSDLKVAAQRSTARPVYTANNECTEGYFEMYPLRPGAEACGFYLETGHCRFGEGCHFHHPPEKRVKLNKAGFPMRADRPPCQVYLDTGFCDYGKSCMKHHPNLDVVPGAVRSTPQFTPGNLQKFSNSTFEVIDEDWTRNFPQREGEPACSHFTLNGTCRFGSKCKFHHPLDAVTPLNNFGLPLRFHAPVCEYFCKTGGCRFGATCSKHHPNLHPGPEGLQPNGTGQIGGMRGGGGAGGDRGRPGPRHGMPGPGFPISDDAEGFFAEFASNPGKEPCPNFVRTGHCKFGASCMFDHPPQFRVKLNRDGLPLRANAEVCKFYLTNGECGFGRQCMHHHPNLVRGGMDMLTQQAPPMGHGYNGYGAAPEQPEQPQRWGGAHQPVYNGGQAGFAAPHGEHGFIRPMGPMIVIPQQQQHQQQQYRAW